ncbi:hypothetical protein CHCC20441_4461 [Bacillus licheniformis]|nr:hypothetical protein B4124_0304 [Bacillus licheniformis]TWN15873.1 hypothetical protein CHCC14564_0438 [Bacillus licheniformis LMG 17339]TWJ37242.1 hypothetical protein CHCC5025_4609 [Bacillus licheniformis]TWJ70320.1 hypothetical protein CHCC5020_0369 [Bacillus licheniformis]TWJ89774.1 hypothetical protein CHCC20496_2700 [Bacillus licheniformis]
MSKRGEADLQEDSLKSCKLAHTAASLLLVLMKSQPEWLYILNGES